MKGQPETIRLIGAGLNGPLLAIFLARRGFRVEIYERRPDMRRVRLSAGRSINLALSTRGIHGLTKAGLWSAMQNIIIPMKGRMIHSVSGELSFQPYGKDATEVIYSISRAELNMALISAAEAEGVQFHFERRQRHAYRKDHHAHHHPDQEVAEAYQRSEPPGMRFVCHGGSPAAAPQHGRQRGQHHRCHHRDPHPEE